MAEFDLRGFLCCGKYQVNDYVIHVERVTNGVRIKVEDGAGNVQDAVIRDGEPGMTDDEIAAIRNLYNTLAKANGDWTEAEEGRVEAEAGRAAAEAARVEAEAARDLAENGPSDWDPTGKTDEEIEEHDLGNRAGLYRLMLALYNKLHPGVDDMLRDAQEARDQAKQYRDETLQNLYYYNGDKLQFNASADPGTPKSTTIQVCDTISSVFNSTGYAVKGGNNAGRLHIKFPVAKRLDKITGITCESLKMTVYSNNGEAMNKTSGDAYDYKPHITKIIIDKIQNCIGLILQRTDGSDYYNIQGKDVINARVNFGTEELPAISFVLEGEEAPSMEGGSES